MIFSLFFSLLLLSFFPFCIQSLIVCSIQYIYIFPSDSDGLFGWILAFIRLSTRSSSHRICRTSTVGFSIFFQSTPSNVSVHKNLSSFLFFFRKRNRVKSKTIENQSFCFPQSLPDWLELGVQLVNFRQNSTLMNALLSPVPCNLQSRKSCRVICYDGNNANFDLIVFDQSFCYHFILKFC